MTRLLWPQEKASYTDEIHELKVVTFDPMDQSYPVSTSSTPIGLYSTIEKAEAQMRQMLGADGDPAEHDAHEHDQRIHHFVLLSRPLDVAELWLDEYEKRVYDDQGILHGTRLPAKFPFSGRLPENCLYREGDLVETLGHDGLLQLGIVSLLPLSPKSRHVYPHGTADQTDDVYCVEFMKPQRHHDHLPECDLFKPRLRVTNHARSRLVREYRKLKILKALAQPGNPPAVPKGESSI